MVPKYHTHKSLLLIISIMSPIYEINSLLILPFMCSNITPKSYPELWDYFFLSPYKVRIPCISGSYLNPSCSPVSELHQITGNSSLMGYIVGISRSHSLWEKKKCGTKTAALPKSSAVWKSKQLIAQSFLSEWVSWFEWNKKKHTIL